MTFEQFLKYDIDLDPLGIMIERDADKAMPYLCTPVDARIFGDVGVDGIHFCFVRGFDETVFAVTPMYLSWGEEVHPVAKNFTDFLRLILACGHAAALDQVHAWDEAQFEAYLAKEPAADDFQIRFDRERLAALDEIREKLGLTPMEDPFAYIKALQAEFDYSRIKYTKEYYDYMPENEELPPWNVFFGGGFWERGGAEQPGEDIPIRRRFSWGGRSFYIPAVYSCAKGLVVDICVEVPAQDIRAYMEKEARLRENDADLTDEQQMPMIEENPMTIGYHFEIAVNGKPLKGGRIYSSDLSWNPLTQRENDMEASGLLEHYGLDSVNGWRISRCSLPWATLRKPKIRSLNITLTRMPNMLPGPKFLASAPGDSITFTHPTTNMEHTLTVYKYKRHKTPKMFLYDSDFYFPGNYTTMSCTLSPDLSEDAFSIDDRVQGDQPRPKQIDRDPDGPTAIHLLHPLLPGPPHFACSSFHFEPEYDVDWQIVFYEKPWPDITVELM